MTILSFVLPPFFHLKVVSWPQYQATRSLSHQLQFNGKTSTAVTEKDDIFQPTRYYDPQKLQSSDYDEDKKSKNTHNIEGKGGIYPVLFDVVLMCVGTLFCFLGTYISADAIWEHFRNGTTCS